MMQVRRDARSVILGKRHSFLAAVLLAAPEVVVPAGRSVTVAAAPAVISIPAGRFAMGASADDVKHARALCADELRGGGALVLELSPRCGARFETESPLAQVYLRAFAIDRAEVSEAAYSG